MNVNANLSSRVLHLAGIGLCALLLLAPARSAAAEPATAPPSPATSKAAASKAATSKAAALTPVDNVESRIKRLHDQLRITSEQESLWAPIASAMQDNSKAIADAVQARSGKAPTMNAVEDIQSYSAIAEAHAAGLRNLAAAFAPLYAAMPPAQQQNANAVFANKPAPSRRG